MFESPECNVFIVYEEDRGCGISIIGVFRSRERAESIALESGHFYIEESSLFE